MKNNEANRVLNDASNYCRKTQCKHCKLKQVCKEYGMSPIKAELHILMYVKALEELL